MRRLQALSKDGGRISAQTARLGVGTTCELLVTIARFPVGDRRRLVETVANEETTISFRVGLDTCGTAVCLSAERARLVRTDHALFSGLELHAVKAGA